MPALRKNGNSRHEFHYGTGEITAKEPAPIAHAARSPIGAGVVWRVVVVHHAHRLPAPARARVRAPARAHSATNRGPTTTATPPPCSAATMRAARAVRPAATAVRLAATARCARRGRRPHRRDELAVVIAAFSAAVIFAPLLVAAAVVLAPLPVAAARLGVAAQRVHEPLVAVVQGE